MSNAISHGSTELATPAPSFFARDLLAQRELALEQPSKPEATHFDLLALRERLREGAR